MPGDAPDIFCDDSPMGDVDEIGAISNQGLNQNPDPEESWHAIPTQLSSPSDSTSLSRAQARIRALTLEALKIPFRLEGDGEGWRLLVAAELFHEALEELRRFEAENANWPPPKPPPSPQFDNLLITLSVLGLLGIFHNLTRLDLDLFGLSALDWVLRGNSDAGLVRSGEWWRTVTALTLHADGQHLLGNLLIGGGFILMLCRALGSGLGWSLLLASGALGNLLNAWLQAPLHRSVGASTAVFGAVGLLAGLHLLQERRRWYLPLASALALLALLGSEGENTDLGAHLFGLAVGVILGLPTAYLLRRYGHPAAWLNALLAFLSLALVAGAWWFAIARP